MKKKSIINILYFTFTTLAFTLGYYNNFWGVVEQTEFEKFDIYCQSQVLGRVIKAEKDGIFSVGGLTGWVRDESIMKDMTYEEMTHFQFEIYTKELDIDPTWFVIYDSQLGGQGMTFALLDKISPFSNSQNLKLFWILTSLSLALILSAFIYWVYKNYGPIASLITFLFLLVSPWLTFFGRNIYWILSSFYLPFIIMLLLLFKESETKPTISLGKLFLISMGLVSAKLFFSGFELITAALVMFAVPLFYYLFLRKWKLKFFVKRFTSVVLGSISGIILYTIAYSYQISTIKGSLLYGIKLILENFSRRTHGNSANFQEGYKASLDSKVTDVLRLYFDIHAIDLRIIKVNFEVLFITFIIFSIISFVPKKISPSTYQNMGKNTALVLTTWISILAPLSWFIIFKAHSYVHLYYDDLAWYMPFYLFGVAMIGSVTFSLMKDIVAYFKKRIQVCKFR